MITLYIPTTTLNFNNILSSESISPKSFYERREFGYKRWTPTEENNNDNAIFLYDDLPIFERPNNGLEDHPLTVQVAIDENQVKKIGEGVYYSTKTIYLDPWHTRFIFQTESDKRTTLSMSDASSETKLLRLYRNLMDTRKGKKKYAIPANFNTVLNEEEISHDFTLNRIKGLLYGYYIGANMSLRKEDVKEIVDLRELQNILSSIQSSDDHIPSSTQRERLYDLLRLGFFLYDAEISNGQMLTRVEDSLLQFEQVVANKKEMLLPDSHEIEVVNSHLSSAGTIQNDKELCLFKAWTDFLLSFSSCKYNGKISTINKDLSDEITVKAKTVYGDDWEGSHAKTFLNNLRRHVRGEVFEEQWNNGLLSSIAAVLTHGDDWHKLLLFMQSKGMYDYRLAFSFYGVLNGFANLTRDFTDNIYTTSSDYIASVYKDVYRQLFGRELVTSVENNNISSIKVIRTGKDKSKEETSLTKFNGLIKKVREICSNLKLSKAQKTNLNKAILENGDNESPMSFVNILQGLSGWKKGEKINIIKNGLNIKEKGGKSEKTFSNEIDLFSNPVQKDAQKELAVTQFPNVKSGDSVKGRTLFIDDYANWCGLLATYANPSIMNKLKDDCEWFVNEYQKGGASQYYKHASHDNNKTIPAFKRYIKKKSYSSQVKLDSLISSLLEMYV